MNHEAFFVEFSDDRWLLQAMKAEKCNFKVVIITDLEQKQKSA